jgi:hypothetical protein
MMFRDLERDNRDLAAVPLPGPGAFTRRRWQWLAVGLLYFALSMSVVPDARPVSSVAPIGLTDLAAMVVSFFGILFVLHGIHRTHPGRERFWQSTKQIGRING